MFPEARFVHIHRNPFTVYQSTMYLLDRALKLTRLQGTSGYDWAERSLRLYEEMYDVFFAEREMIPRGQFSEIAFEDLERDTVGQLKRVYEDLSLPSFEDCEHSVRQLLADIGDYQKNQFPALPTSLRAKIASRWRPSFTEWDYKP